MTYSNLHYGEIIRVLVKAGNSDGIWNEEETTYISVFCRLSTFLFGHMSFMHYCS